MEKWLKDVLPVMGVEHDCILSRMGDVTVVYEAALPEIFTLSDQKYEAFHQTWIKAIKILPKQLVFHKQDWFVDSKYQPDFIKTGDSFLSRSSERFFNERPFLDHHCYIMLTKKPANRKASSSLFSTLLRSSIVPEETLKPQSLQDFLDGCGQFKRILEDSGFVQLKRLADNELQSQAGRAGLIERYCFLSENPGDKCIKDITYNDGIRVGGQYCQLYTLSDAADLPALCGSRINYDKYSTDKTKFSIGFASALGQLLPCNHIYNQYIFMDDAQKTIQQLESKRLRLQSLSAYSRENAISRDAVNDFLNEAISQQRLPVKAHFNVLVWTDDKNELKDLKNLVSSALAQMDAVPKQELDGAPQLHWAGIPGNAADFPVNDSFDTFAEQACCFLNLETNYRSSLSPVGIRLGDRLTGKPIHVDISDEPWEKGITTNRNKFILGPTGSGKSFFTNHMLRTYYEQGSHIVVVDVGHSYQGLCQLVGGYYFTYSEEQPIRFNPFYLAPDEVLDTERKESLKTLLLALWKKDDEHYSRSEYITLSNALKSYYEIEIPFRSFNSFYEFLQDYFAGLLKQGKLKERDFDMDNFMYVLQPYHKGGEFDYLLNASETLDVLEQRFIVFELDKIKDHPILFPVVTIMLMDIFISKMRKLKGIRKVLLLEEVWKALMRKGMEDAILYWVKTIRKFYGELIPVTQDIEDILGSKIVKNAIINNSDCKILLDQSKFQNRYGPIQDLLGLTDKEKALALSVNKANDPGKKYKEVFISLGGVLSRVYRTEVSLEEYLAYTTEEKEKVKLHAHAARFGGDMQKGIAAFAEELKKKQNS